jgi:hypothetical protein
MSNIKMPQAFAAGVCEEAMVWHQSGDKALGTEPISSSDWIKLWLVKSELFVADDCASRRINQMNYACPPC